MFHHLMNSLLSDLTIIPAVSQFLHMGFTNQKIIAIRPDGPAVNEPVPFIMSMDHPLYVQASLETLSRLQPGERGVSLDHDRRAELIEAPTLTTYRLSTLEMRNRMADMIHTVCTAWPSLPPANRPLRKMFLTRTTLNVINHYLFITRLPFYSSLPLLNLAFPPFPPFPSILSLPSPPFLFLLTLYIFTRY